MRKVLALGAAILLVGSAGVSIAQERLNSQSGMGVGEGVGDVSGSGTRVTTFDQAISSSGCLKRRRFMAV